MFFAIFARISNPHVISFILSLLGLLTHIISSALFCSLSFPFSFSLIIYALLPLLSASPSRYSPFLPPPSSLFSHLHVMLLSSLLLLWLCTSPCSSFPNLPPLWPILFAFSPTICRALASNEITLHNEAITNIGSTWIILLVNGRQSAGFCHEDLFRSKR